MEFLYLLESIRMPGLNEFMLLVTKLELLVMPDSKGY